MKTGDFQSPSRGRILLYMLAGLLLLSPLPAGSVYSWSVCLIQLVILTLLFFTVCRRELAAVDLSSHPLFRWVLWGFGAFLIFGFLQFLPLPRFVVHLLSPNASGVQNLFQPDIKAGSLQTLSLFSSRTFQSFLLFIGYAAIVVLVIYIVRTLRRVRWIFSLLTGIGAILSVYGIVELFHPNPSILFYKKIYYLDSVTGSFVNRNHFSAYICMILPLTMALLWNHLSHPDWSGFTLRERLKAVGKNGFRKTVLLFCASFVMIAAVLLSRSRSGGFLLLLMVVLLFGTHVIYTRPFKTISSHHMSRAFFVLLILIILFVGIENSINRFSMEETLREGQTLVWRSSLRILGQFPLFGTGLGTFSSVYPLYEDQWKPGFYSHTNNDYLEFLSELGFLGFFLLIFPVVLLLLISFMIWRTRRNPEIKILGLGGMVGSFVMLANSVTDSSLHIPANLVLFSTLIGLSFVCVGLKTETNPDGNKQPVPVGGQNLRSKLDERIKKIASQKEDKEWKIRIFMKKPDVDSDTDSEDLFGS
ncbi:MAG: O-antigen ligase family protein [Acidobacteriota bacterium]